jgi:hypothetical protein
MLLSLVLLGTALTLASIAPAWAGGPTQDIYGGALGREISASNDPGSSASTSSNGAVPFTGLDVGIVILAGAFLVGTGFAIRRASRAPRG